MKKEITKSNFRETLADVIELKGFSEQSESLLLNMLYKIDESYENYKTVKREVPSKENFIQKLIVIVRSRIKNVQYAVPHTQGMTFYKNNLLKCIEKEPDYGAANSYATANRLRKNFETYVLLSLPNEKDCLYNISKLGAFPINPKLPIEDRAILTVINIGRSISDSEVIRDFTGWAWTRDPKEIENNQCNIIYTFLTFLLGERFINSITDVGQIKDNVSKEFYDLLVKCSMEFYTATNKSLIDNYLSKISSLRDELDNIKHQVKYQENIIMQKKSDYADIKKIDIALSSPKELKIDFIATNNALPQGKKFYSISDYEEYIVDKKKTLLRDINKLNKMQDPTEVMKMQDDILMKIKFYEEKTSIPELSREFLKMFEAKIDYTKSKRDILNLIYEVRYLNFLPDCNLKLKTCERKVVVKGIKCGIINPVSNIDDLDYRILRGIFQSETSDLSSLSIEVSKEYNGLNVEMFDGDVHDKTYLAETPKDSDIEVRKVKKYKIFA